NSIFDKGSLQDERVAHAQEFALFGGGDAGVGGETIKVIEALCGRSRRQGSAAHVGKLFLEADQVCAGAWVARWHRASSARIAAFKRHVSNFEAYRIIFSFAEESIFPERGHAIDFKCGAKTFARFLQFDSLYHVAE